jgi:chromate transporter
MLGKATFVDGWAWGIGVVSALLLLRFQVNATWVILGGAALGLLLRGLH